jgi:anti-sigma regulatory factor (Ser/Thr protein kinase)/putative methionine-R-sulfoxide reductase with GAF domain
MVRSLQTVSDAALAHLTLEDLLPELLERTREIMSADSVSVYLTDPDRDGLQLRAGSGVPTAGVGLEVPLDKENFAGRVAKERRAIFVEDVQANGNGRGTFEPGLLESELRSVLGVPLVAEGAVRGVLRVASVTPGRFDSNDASLLALIADRAALAIGNARLYDREHRVVETLQRSLLPSRLPQPPGTFITARYRPGGDDVGGDWYDAVWLEDGTIGLAMGDVAGHGIEAAALMGQLRNVLRAYAVETPSPEDAVTRLNRLLGRERSAMATLTYAAVDLNAGRLRYTSAGHPPPLVIGPDGETEFLWQARSCPLGVGQNDALDAAEADLPPGSTLLLYTDGLVEVPGETLDAGLERLRRCVNGGDHAPDPLCDRVMSELADVSGRDDIAVLALQSMPLDRDLISLQVSTDGPSLRAARGVLLRWLDHHGAAREEANDIALAAYEGCTNAARHGYGFGDETFTLEAEHTDGEVALTVRDSGSWREPGANDFGKGLVLMRGLMDDVDVDRGPDGTVVHMRRRLSLTAQTA